VVYLWYFKNIFSPLWQVIGWRPRDSHYASYVTLFFRTNISFMVFLGGGGAPLAFCVNFEVKKKICRILKNFLKLPCVLLCSHL
jgi:hypothetical protein